MTVYRRRQSIRDVVEGRRWGSDGGATEATFGGGDPAATVGGGDEPATMGRWRRLTMGRWRRLTMGRLRRCGRDGRPPSRGVFVGRFARIRRGRGAWLQTWTSDVGGGEGGWEIQIRLALRFE
nr:unnamed protein product [Digitaria exilis]